MKINKRNNVSMINNKFIPKISYFTLNKVIQLFNQKEITKNKPRKILVLYCII